MKRAGKLFDDIADMENLRLAFWKVSRGKQEKKEIIEFRSNLGLNLKILRKELLSNTVTLGNYHYFTIYDPKERLICAASFPERVIHHAVMNICEPVFERFLISDTYACRKNKGTYKAIQRAVNFTRKNKFYLKLDIRKYFDSISHDILLNLLARKFKDRRLFQFYHLLINTYKTDPGRGLPIGNLTSQHFGNFYLGWLDHYVKETLCLKYYVRYMDDFIIWSNSKAELKSVKKQVLAYLENTLQLELKNSYCLNYTGHGCSFLGYRLFPDYIRLNSRSKNRFIKKFRHYETMYANNIIDEDGLNMHFQPLFAFAMKADTLSFRKYVLTTYGRVFENVI